MIKTSGRHIKFPSTLADLTEAKRRWQTKYDCTHIKIKKPPIRCDKYRFISRKGYYSIKVQATRSAID
nr:unnamed protein product [Callosobruchus analis]